MTKEEVPILDEHLLEHLEHLEQDIVGQQIDQPALLDPDPNIEWAILTGRWKYLPATQRRTCSIPNSRPCYAYETPSLHLVLSRMPSPRPATTALV